MRAAATGALVVGVALRGASARRDTQETAAVPARDDAQALIAILPPPRNVIERSARQSLADGASWQATVTLTPRVDSALRATAGASARSAGTSAAGVSATGARSFDETLMLAATAAAARGEWSTVGTLLRTVPDSTAGGFGLLLRARAAFARGAAADPVAAGAAARVTALRAAYALARRAAELAPNATERGVRLTLAARALDRVAIAASGATEASSVAAAALADSVRVAYVAAGETLTPLADWMTLRAMEVTRDAERRRATAAGIRTAVARERVTLSEATARERAGHRDGASAAYRAAGRPMQALALQVTDAAQRRDSNALDALRDSLLRVVAARSGTADARQATALLDASYSAVLSPSDELMIARSAAVSGPAARAIRGYERAFSVATVGETARDRYSYATLLGRSGRVRDAITQFERVQSGASGAGRSLAGVAAYERALLLLRTGPAGGVEARRALADVAKTFAGDTVAAANALALLADLAVDDGRDADARRSLLDLAEHYPSSGRASAARFDAAIIAFARRDVRTARVEFDALRVAGRSDAPGRVNVSDVSAAATYWAGRAAAAAGDKRVARERWSDVATRAPISYYAVLARRRLGTTWSPTTEAGANAEPNSRTTSGAVGGTSATAAASRRVADEAVRRIALLQRVGFDAESGWERDWLVRWASADVSADRALLVARGLRDVGATSAAMRLAGRVLDDSDDSVKTSPSDASALAYALAYPWPWRSLVRDAARARGLDPALVAAVIRQESNFTPTATSPAGAMGLMQLLPSVGRALWGALGAAGTGGVRWDASLLHEPDVSVALGTRHLAAAIGQYPDAAYALAAYNAGGTPVARWRRRAGADDPELFVERIPYDETRDYVRIVTRNAATYRALYGR